jgi:hypothetical protein
MDLKSLGGLGNFLSAMLGGPKAAEATTTSPSQTVNTPTSNGKNPEHAAAGTALAKIATGAPAPILASDPVKTGLIQKALNIIKATLVSFGLNFGEIAKAEGFISKEEVEASYVSKDKVALEVASQAQKLQDQISIARANSSQLNDGQALSSTGQASQGVSAKQAVTTDPLGESIKAVLSGKPEPEAFAKLQAEAQATANTQPLTTLAG